MTERYKRHSINLDDQSHANCKALADDMGVSISGMIRILIKQAFEKSRQFGKEGLG
jgi:hypothetical protein